MLRMPDGLISDSIYDFAESRSTGAPRTAIDANARQQEHDPRQERPGAICW
jgi:hypothetical protein